MAIMIMSRAMVAGMEMKWGVRLRLTAHPPRDPLSVAGDPEMILADVPPSVHPIADAEPVGPDPADARWWAENGNQDWHDQDDDDQDDAERPDPDYDAMADDAAALSRLEMGWCC